MKRLPGVLINALVTVLVAVPAPGAGAQSEPEYALTIYSRAQPGAVDPALYRPGRYQAGAVPGYAVVRRIQSRTLEAGVSELRVQDVASLIDPTTVSIRSTRADDMVRVLEQSFEFDLVSSEKLLDRYLDRRIVVLRSTGQSVTQITGRLLSTDGGLVLGLSDGKVQIVTEYEDITLPDLPGGLITRPTLVWQVQTAEAGERELQISYQTDGMTWWTDYNATLRDDNGCELDVNAWVSIVNQSGAGYPEARLKLIAGDVQRVSSQEPQVMMEMARSKRDEDTGFQEKSFFEYHLYTLPRRTALASNSTKQLELFPSVRGVPCEREYIYDARQGYPGYYHDAPVLDQAPGWTSTDDIAVYLTFRNDTESGLGVPLPAGRLRVNQQDDADGSLEFIGEDVLDHTPRDEDVRIKLGNAFDIVAERKQADFQVGTQLRKLRESFQIELRNHKETPATIQINEALYRWVNWEIIESSHEFEKIDARSIRFSVPIDPDETTNVEYEVQYTW